MVLTIIASYLFGVISGFAALIAWALWYEHNKKA